MRTLWVHLRVMAGAVAAVGVIAALIAVVIGAMMLPGIVVEAVRVGTWDAAWHGAYVSVHAVGLTICGGWLVVGARDLLRSHRRAVDRQKHLDAMRAGHPSKGEEVGRG